MIQVPISNYFKSASSGTLKIKVARKRKSCEPSSSSTPKKSDSDKTVVIDLVSDSDEDLKSQESESHWLDPLLIVECVMPDSDMKTPCSSQSTIYGTSDTPKSDGSKSNSNMFSPSKKKSAKRSPIKRNLAKDSFAQNSQSNQSESVDDELEYVLHESDDKMPMSNYFKSVSSGTLKMKVAGKRRSCEPSSSSTPKKSDSDKIVVIDLVSDSEEDLKSQESESVSDVETPCSSFQSIACMETPCSSFQSIACMETPCSSFQSIACMETPCSSFQSIADMETPCSSFQSIADMETPYSSSQSINGTPDTPKYNNLKSSGSMVSPKKKKSVKRSPIKRNLPKNSFAESSQSNQSEPVENKLEHVLYESDDKTNFLRQLINKYLNTNELRNLLDQKSEEFLSKTVQFDISCMMLICTLYRSKQSFYKQDKLAAKAKGKQEIDSSKIQEILRQLTENGWITESESLSFDDCIDLLQVKQCTDICKELRLKCIGTSKESAKNAIIKYSLSKPIFAYFTNKATRVSNIDRVLKLLRSKVGSCYRLSELANETLDKLYLLMYLGMDYTLIREKKLECVLIKNKNGIKTHPVDIGMITDNASVVFKTSVEFERYFEAHKIYENFLSETDAKKRISIIQNVFERYNSIGADDMETYISLPIWLRTFTPAYLYIRIIEKGIEDLKRNLQYQSAVDMLSVLIAQNAFRQHKKGEWYHEKALILHKYIRGYDMAGEVLLEGLQSDIPKILKQCLLHRLKKLVYQKNITLRDDLLEQLLSVLNKEPPIMEKNFDSDHVYAQHVKHEGKGKRLFITHTNDGIIEQNAEDYCLSYYYNNELFTNGGHWETDMITTVFTLLFWDIIYMKLREYSGIFLTPYQVYPLDMFTCSFYENRKQLIEERLAWIERSGNDDIREAMRKVWDSRPESEESDINRNLGWEKVCEMCAYAGGVKLARLCRRLATDYEYCHTGFPDLTLWNNNTKQIKFIEVKTDTDTPRIKQLQWMHFLQSMEIDTGFCYLGDKTERNKARSKPAEQPDSLNASLEEQYSIE